MKADDFLADVPSADDFLGEPEPRKPRRDRIRNPYVAPDNPADPILPTGGSVLQDVQMPVPTFTEDRQNRALVNRAIESNTPAPRAPRPVRDAKGIAQDLYSILGNTGVQLVKPFVDVPNILLGGALDPAVGFLNNASRAANEAASPTTQYDRETLANIPEGQTLEKAATLISNPGLAANMGIPSAASMVMPMAAVKGASLLAPRTALAMGDKFATGTAVGANALMNAGDTFGQTESDIPGRLLAALGSGAASALVGKATGGGLEGQLARGGGVPTVGAALRSVGNESVQEFGENVGNQLAQDTGEGKPLNLAKAIDEGTIGALLAPFVSGPINAAQLATSPERRNASLLAGAINADASSMPARPDVMDNSLRAQPAPVAERPVTPATPAPVPQLPYDPAVQNPQRPVVVDAQGNEREMTADEFLAADDTRQGDKAMGLISDVRRAQAARNAGEQESQGPAAPNQPTFEKADGTQTTQAQPQQTQQPPEPQRGVGEAQAPTPTSEVRNKWPGLKGKSDEHIQAAEDWSNAERRVKSEFKWSPLGDERVSSIEDATIAEMGGQPGVARDQVGYLKRLTERLNSAADEARAERDTPGTLANKRQEKEDVKRREESAAFMQKATEQDVEFNLQRVRDLRRQGRISDADESRLLDLARSSKDGFDAAMKLEGFVSSKEVPGRSGDVQQTTESANDAPTPPDGAAAPAATGWTPQQEVFAGKPDLAPEQRQELDQANAQDLESMYQQEVKDGIKQRLGIDQQQAPEARTETSAFRTFLRDLGIAPDLAGDVTGERGFKANSRMPGTFRKGGLQLDEIVTRAVERGFLTDAQVESTLDNGGTNALVEMIRAELRGERQVSNDVADERAQSAIDNRALEDLDQRARAIGFDTKGLDGDQINLALKRIERRRARNQQINAKREALAERQAMRDAQDFDSLDDSDIPWDNDSNVSTEDAMRSLGFSQQEIDDAIADRPAAAQEDRSSDGAPWQDAAGPAQGTPAAYQGSAPGQQGQAQPAVSESQPNYTSEPAGDFSLTSTPYDQDLFGDSTVQQQPRKDRPTEPASAPIQRDVQPEPGLQDTAITEGEYFTNTIIGSEVTRQLGASRITAPEHAATATQYLYKSAVERLDAIVTDKDGKPLAVVGGFKGALAKASVYPATIVAEAVRIPGAAHIWFSHNHPSGKSNLSRADENLNQTLTDVFRGSGIEPMGLMAVTGQNFSFVGVGALGSVISGRPISKATTQTPVPVVERQQADGRPGAEISSPWHAKQIAGSFYKKTGQPGLLLLNSQNEVSAWIPISEAMKGDLRGTGQLNSIYRAISQSNAGAAIIVHGGELDAKVPGRSVTASENIAAALAKVDVQALDVVDVKAGTSAAEQGKTIAKGPMYSRPNPRAAGATIDTLRTALTKRFGADIARMEARGFLKLWPSTQAFNDGQTSEHIDGPAQGYWDGKVAHLFADGIESGNEVAVLLHEVGEHASMKKMLGPQAYGKLVERAYDLVDANDPTALRAVDRIPDDTPAHYKDSEFLAYMIETVASDGAKATPSARKWLADIVAAIRAWFSQTGFNKMLDRFGKGIELTPADIAALAVRAVRWQAEQGGGGGGQFSRYDVGRVLKKEERAAVLKTLTDVYKTKQAPREQKGFDSNGNERFGYVHSPDLFEKSDVTGSMVRHYVTLPDGRKAHPTELFPDFTQSHIDRAMAQQSDDERQRVSSEESRKRILNARKADTLGEANRIFNTHNAGARSYTPAILTDGKQFIRTAPEAAAKDIELLGDGWRVQGATGQVSRPSNAAAAAANVFGGTPNAPATPAAPAGARNTAQQQQPNAASWAVAEPGRLDDFTRYIQNSRIDIKRTVDAVKAAGQHVADDANPYLMDELYIGKVRAQLDRLADESVKPLLQAIANSGFTPEQVNEYLWARHAEERNRQMAKVNAVPFTQALDLAGMSTTDANAKLAAFQAMPEFRKMQAIARMVDRITMDARTKIVTDGLEEPGVIQAWEGAYRHYVPLQRDMEEAGGKASGYNVKGSESRRAVGSKKEAINILANVIAQAEATIIRSEKAAVGRSVLDMARQHPNKDFWTVDIPPTERVIDPRTGLVTTKVKANYKALDNVFTVKEAGVEHFVVFNEDNPRAVQFARTLKNMDAANMGPVMQAISKGTRYLAQWVTSRNPLFWMTNFARDVQGVAFNLQSTPLKGQAPQVMANIPQALGGFARLNAGKKTGQWTVMAQRFKDAGGQTGYIDQYRDSVERMRDIIKEIEQQRQSKADPRKIGRGVLAVLEGANDAIENGVRLAVFAQAVNDGISDAQAASIAKNISVNFNRKGNATAVYNALYMFMNANIQGNVRMIQGVMQSRRAQVYAGALTLAGAAVALMNLTAGGDDDKTRKKRYELVPEWERERNWIVFIPGTDDYVKIPLPLGPHVLFNAGRILAELGLEDGADPFEKASSFVSSMISAFNPIGGGFPTPDAKGLAQLATPTVARPVVDTVLNQNFAGIPITREGNPWGYNKPAYLNGRENTPSYWTTAAKAMNDWTGGDNVKPGAVNLSPEQLAYLVKGYVVPGIAQTADKVAGQAMSRKDTPMDQIVGVSKFFGSIDDNERRRAGYETLRRDEQFLGEYKNYIKAGEQEKARETLKKWGGGSEANGRKLLGQYNATDRVLSMYRKQKKTAGDEKLDEINGRIDRTLSVYQANTKDLRRQ